MIDELKNSPFDEEQKLGEDLKNLRIQRNIADYSNTSQDFPITSTKNIVEEIFSILDSLKRHPIRLMKK